MRWDWDTTGDDRVVRIWDLRERLSRRTDVIYSKWYQGRATFFSLPVFKAILSYLHHGDPSNPTLQKEGHQLWNELISNSPQSTKTLKKLATKQWKWEQKVYNAAMKELWMKGLILGCGEVDDGAFPSLNVTATKHYVERLWNDAHTDNLASAEKTINASLPQGSLWRKQLIRIQSPRTEKKPKSGKLKYEDLVRS